MALEAVEFQQDPFSHCSCKDFYTFGGGEEDPAFYKNTDLYNINVINVGQGLNVNREHPSPPGVKNSTGDEFSAGIFSGAVAPAAASGKRKRRRTRSVMKNKEEVENQRMMHIAVERNRRKQMNDYLASLRSMMPASYVQRGDQASIIGGAINFVKQLEQLLHFLEAQKQIKQRLDPNVSSLFSDFFTFPQYTTRSAQFSNPAAATESVFGKQYSSDIADLEVTMVESHANVKILSRRQPKLLLKMVSVLQSLGLNILHLNVTTVDHMILCSFNVKAEDDCQMTSVNEIAAAMHEIVRSSQEEFGFS